MTHLGIPTRYAGVQFRSRLEAKWAAFFDLLEWPWTYEPFDLVGYIPDFILNFEHIPVLIEVKGPDAEHEAAVGKYMRCVTEAPWLLVGHDFQDNPLGRGPAIGQLYGGKSVWASESPDACTLAYCTECKRWTLRPDCGCWECMQCGAWDGQNHLDLNRVPPTLAEAGNRVQWKAPRIAL